MQPAAGDPGARHHRGSAAQGRRRRVEGGRRDGAVAPGALPPDGTARDRARAPPQGLSSDVITIRTRLTLVVVLATVAGAIVGWLLRGTRSSRARSWAASRPPRVRGLRAARGMLVTDPATSILQAVSDGLLSFTEREYGMRLAAPTPTRCWAIWCAASTSWARRCAPSTTIATSARSCSRPCSRRRRWRSCCATRRCASSTRTAPRASCSARGASWTARTSAPSWRPRRAAFRQAIEQETDTIFSVENRDDGAPEAARAAGAPETYHLARRYFQLTHAAAHPLHPQAADARDPAQGGGHLEADDPRDQPRDQQLARADLVADPLGPADAAEARDGPAPRRGAGHHRGAQRPPARLHRGLRQVRAPADARQAGEPLAAAGRRPASPLLVPGRGPAAGAAGDVRRRDRCSRC